MKIRKLVHKSATKSELVSSKIYEGDKTIVKSLYSMVSLGTEKLVAQGKVSSEATRFLRVPHMEGDFSLPCTYGYSLVGEALSGKYEGRLVHMLHPHQDYAFVQEKEVYPIPKGVTAERAVLASNLETAVNAVWDSSITMGDKVVVYGFGTVGAFTAYLAKRIPGVKVYISEINKNRRTVAKDLGFSLLEDQSGFDVAFNTTRSSKALQNAIDLTRKDGRIIELSWYGTDDIKINLGSSFHYDRKQIISSQVSTISPNKPGWSFKNRKKLVFKLLKNKFFDSLPTSIISFSKSEAFFEDLRNGNINELCVLFEY